MGPSSGRALPLRTGRGCSAALRLLRFGAGCLCLLSFAAPLSAQDLDPRAYANAPVGTTFFVAGFGVSHGGVITDPTVPIANIVATVETPSVGVGRAFGLFGMPAQTYAVLPVSWAQVSGDVLGDAQSTTRAGLSDMRFRFALLVHGAKAASLPAFLKAPRRTILGVSFTASAPTGQYYPDKLINLGTNRWAFKPEFAVSHPLGPRWMLDTYAGLWFFTTNSSYYPGTSVRSQNVEGALQAHLSYNISPALWTAFDATYYVGARATTNGVPADGQFSDWRLGGTLNVPIGRRHAMKFAVSRGALVRYGSNFTTFSIGWQTAWVPKPKVAR